MNLRAKIITGYLILVAVIGSMAAILIHERQRIRDIEVETFEIREIRRSKTTFILLNIIKFLYLQRRRFAIYFQY